MKKIKILLAEDTKSIADAVAFNLEYQNYDCKVFEDGLDVVNFLKSEHDFDLAVLDIMLPNVDGFELLEHMKKYNIPVIYMTAKTDLASEIRGLRKGAEDYITKPFEMLSLLVRIEKILERHGKMQNIYTFKDIEINNDEKTVKKLGEEIKLPPLEFDVLLLLIKNKNRTISRDKILDEVWGMDFFGDTRTVDVRIANIRKKLSLKDEIRSISKTGYRLEER